MVGHADEAAVSSWYEEKQSAWLYRVLAEVESRATLSQLFATLAGEADDQAALWAAKLSAGGVALPEFSPTVRARIVAWLARRFGVKPIRQVLAGMKVRGMSAYSGAHPGGHSMPATVEEVGQSHRGVGGGNLRAAVFGANDGLISNASLIMGIAGATADSHLILLTGVAGLLAGALSMASGEFVSVRSQRELYEHQMALEQDELDEYPEEEAEELALIYAARGMDLDEARWSRTRCSSTRSTRSTCSRAKSSASIRTISAPPGALPVSRSRASVSARWCRCCRSLSAPVGSLRRA